MKNCFIIIGLLLTAFSASAQIELGLGVGQTNTTAKRSFTDIAKDENSNNYWLGYQLDNYSAVQLDHDHLDFEQTDLKTKAYTLAYVLSTDNTAKIYPFLKAGLGIAQHKFDQSSFPNKNQIGVKLGLGLNFDLIKYLGLQAGISYHYFDKVTDTAKNAQLVNPYIGIKFNFGKETVAAVTERIEKAVAKTDTDKDGVADEDDKCPNTAAGTKVNSYGCADKETASVKLNVLFKTGQAVITDDSQAEIIKFADFMKQYPNVKAHIKGYTDNTGAEALNIRISNNRAQAVKKSLIANGINADRIQATGYGPKDPIADNTSDAGRQQNRRVVAEITNK